MCVCVYYTRAALLLYCVRDGTRMLPAPNTPSDHSRAPDDGRGGTSRRIQLLQPEPSSPDSLDSRSLTALACGRVSPVAYRRSKIVLYSILVPSSVRSLKFPHDSNVSSAVPDTRARHAKRTAGTTTTMDDVQNGGSAAVVVVSRPPSSDTCGLIVNHIGDDGRTSAVAAAQTAASPPVAAAVVAAALGVASPTACPAPPYGVHLNNNNNNNPLYKGQLKVRIKKNTLPL